MSNLINRKLSWKRIALASIVSIAGLANHAAGAEAVWTGTNSDNWSDPLNWSTGIAPTTFDDVKFTNADGVDTFGPPPTTVNPGVNIVDASKTINSLWYSNLQDPFSSAVGDFAHNTQIGTGTTLTIINGRVPSPATADGPYAIWVGAGPGVDSGSGKTLVTMTGGGSINLGSAIDIVVRATGAAGATRDAELNMSGLANFTGKFEKLLVGTADANLGANAAFAVGTLKLAQNTVLTSQRHSIGNIPNPTDNYDVVTIGYTPSGLSSSSTGSMELGQSATFNVSSFTVAKERSSAAAFNLSAVFPGSNPITGFSRTTFQTGLTNPTLTLRGKDAGNSRLSYFAIGDTSDSTATQTVGNNSLRNTSGVVDLTNLNGGSNGSIDAKIDVMYLGRSLNSTAGNSRSFGSFIANAGTLDVNTLRVGWQQLNASVNNYNRQWEAIGVMHLGGTLTTTVNGNTNLGHDAGALNRTGVGIINLTGQAIFNAYGHISENASTGGNGHSEFTLADNAVLNMKPGSDELGGDILVDTLTVGAGTTINNPRNITTGSLLISEVSGLQPDAAPNLTVVTTETGTALSGSGTINGLSGTLTVNYSNPTAGSFNGNVSGTGSFVKTGTGIYALGGSNTYTGSTTVTGGVLQLTSSTALGGSSTVNVGTGTTLDVSSLGSYSVPVGQTVTGLGSVTGGINLPTNSFISAGAATLDIGTLTTQDVTLNGGTYIVDVTAAGTNDLVAATNVNVAALSRIYINPTGADVVVGTQNIMSYSGSLTAGTLIVTGPLAAGESRRTATIGNTGPSGGNITVTFGGSAPVASTWNGNGGTNRWEANGADNNWNAGGGANTSKYFNLDTATFGAAGGANTSVNIAEAVYAGSIAVTAGNYTFTGAGAFTTPSLSVSSGASLTVSNSSLNAVTGAITVDGTLTSNQSVNYTNPIGITGAATGSLIKTGSNRETLTGNNSGYLGTIAVQNGTLRIGSTTALGGTAAGTTISATGTLDLNGFDVGNEPISVSGAGVGGIGAITQLTEDVNSSNKTDVVYYSGATLTAAEAYGISLNTGKISNLTLNGATTLGSQGTSAWAVTASATNASNFTGNNNNLTKVGSGYVRLISQGDTELANVDIQKGTLSFEFVNFSASTLATTLGNSAGTLTVRNGATLGSINAPTGAANTSTVALTADKNLVFENNSTWLFQSTTAAPNQTALAYNPSLISSGTISLTGDVRFNFQAFSSAQNALINSNISGTGNLIKDGAGSLILAGDNSGWTGDITLTNGSLKIVNPLSVNNNTDINNALVSGILQFEPTANTTIVVNGNISGSGLLNLSGFIDPTGVVVLGGNNTFEGSVNINTGTLRVRHNNALGQPGANVLSLTRLTGAAFTGKLEFDNNVTTLETIDMPVRTTTAPHIDNFGGNNTIVTAITVSNSTASAPNLGINSSGGTLNIAGGLGTITGTSTANLILNLGGTAAGNFSGPIHSTGVTSLNIAKSGSGIWNLTGTNTYVGTTTVNAGILQFGTKVALYNNTPASWTDTNIIVESGGTLAVSVGGAGEFALADVDTLKALGTATGGFKSGSSIGIDTTNAGGPLTYSSVISNTNAGANSIGFAKLGSGTLNLSAVNTYTGNTTVLGGTLNITGSHTTGSNYSVASGANLITNNVRATSTLTVNGTATINSNGGTTGASKVETLAIGAGGKLNLKDNDLVVGTAPNVTAVRAAIKTGVAGAAGITSDLPAFGVTTGFGYALGNDAALSPLLAGSLTGQTYDADSVLVKYTFLGDADLDGDSDLNDLGLWAQSFTGDLGNPAIPVTFWTSGDFDYDGDTDLNDLGFWAGTFTGDLGGGAGSLIVVASGAPAGAVAALNSMGITVAVPEPSTFVLAGVGLTGLAIATRRRKK